MSSERNINKYYPFRNLAMHSKSKPFYKGLYPLAKASKSR